MAILENEIEVFCNYLIHQPPNAEIKNRYQEAVNILHLQLTKKEAQLVAKIIQRPILLPFIDGAFALINPNSGIRKRLLTLSALLETDMQYVQAFLTSKDLNFPLVHFLYTGAKGVITGVIGVCIVKIMRWN